MPVEQLKIKVTSAQKRAWKQALDKAGAAQSDTLRGLIRQYCESQGIVFPDDMPGHGENLKGSDNYNIKE